MVTDDTFRGSVDLAPDICRPIYCHPAEPNEESAVAYWRSFDLFERFDSTVDEMDVGRIYEMTDDRDLHNQFDVGWTEALDKYDG